MSRLTARDWCGPRRVTHFCVTIQSGRSPGQRPHHAAEQPDRDQVRLDWWIENRREEYEQRDPQRERVQHARTSLDFLRVAPSTAADESIGVVLEIPLPDELEAHFHSAEHSHDPREADDDANRQRRDRY